MCADPRVRGMASSSRKRVRLMIDVNFGSLEDKGAFVRRLQSVRERLTPAGSAPIDNSGLMCAMLDAVEQLAPQPSTPGSVEPAVASFMRSSGKFYS